LSGEQQCSLLRIAAMIRFSPHHVTITLIVLAYFVVSISLVFVNKFVITEGTAIPAPLFVTWFQCILTALIVWALGSFASNFPKNSFLKEFPLQTFDVQTAKGIFPLSLIFVGMITFNNLCLLYVEVGTHHSVKPVMLGPTEIFPQSSHS